MNAPRHIVLCAFRDDASAAHQRFVELITPTLSKVVVLDYVPSVVA